MKKTVANVTDYCKRNGVCVYDEWDQKDRRKKYYKMLIPVFEEGNLIPVSNTEYCVKNMKECYEYMNKLLEDDKFRANTAAWVRSWYKPGEAE